MKTQDLTSILVALSAALIAVCGWFAVNWLNARRERANKRRDLRTHHLVKAFLTIAAHSNRITSRSKMAEIEAALAEIQLFGTNRQIATTREFIASLVNEQQARTDDLMGLIRDDIRQELKLEPATAKLLWIVWPDSLRNKI